MGDALALVLDWLPVTLCQVINPSNRVRTMFIRTRIGLVFALLLIIVALISLSSLVLEQWLHPIIDGVTVALLALRLWILLWK